MENIYYIGLDVHKKSKSIAYYIKTFTGKIVHQGMVKVERRALQQRLVDIPDSWIGAMEATMYTYFCNISILFLEVFFIKTSQPPTNVYLRPNKYQGALNR